MTGTEIMAAVTFILMLLGTVGGVWFRVEGKINSAKEGVTNVKQALADHKLHVAENYTTKSGMREIKDEILGALGGVRDDVRHLATRMDSLAEGSKG